MPHDMPDDFDVDVQLTRFIRRVRERTMRELSNIDAKLDYGTYLIFAAIHDAEDGVRASELAESFSVHKSTVSRAVATLESMGLVERETDPDDGRAQILTVTPQAAERFQDFRRDTHVWFAKLLDGWTEAERTELARGMRRLNETPDPAA